MIKGLDKLQRDLAEVEKTLKALDGTLGSVECDPHDPLSIEQAIAKIHGNIDDRVGSYNSNAFVRSVVEGYKETARQHIIDQAVQRRLSEGER